MNTRMTDLLILMFAFTLSLLVATSCAYRIPTDPYAIGGPGWRVFDANRITSPEALAALRIEFASVSKCVGKTRPFPTHIYAVSAIVYKSNPAWGKATGMWLSRAHGAGKDRIYVQVTGLPEAYVRRTFRHESVHYLTEQGHPGVDAMMEKCV